MRLHTITRWSAAHRFIGLMIQSSVYPSQSRHTDKNRQDAGLPRSFIHRQTPHGKNRSEAQRVQDRHGLVDPPLGREGRHRDHRQPAVLELLQLKLLLLGVRLVLVQPEWVEAEVASGSLGRALEESVVVCLALDEADGGEDLGDGQGVLLQHGLVDVDPVVGLAVEITRDHQTQPVGRDAQEGKHADAAVLQLRLPKPLNRRPDHAAVFAKEDVAELELAGELPGVPWALHHGLCFHVSSHHLLQLGRHVTLRRHLHRDVTPTAPHAAYSRWQRLERIGAHSQAESDDDGRDGEMGHDAVPFGLGKSALLLLAYSAS
mmetsp:Transcript_5246/g.14430  ORF Transcript_5246/g.14430 Transcript_5246/m.14430 type:complete len:318 (-) Transcript_5246:4-957(-)